MVLTLTLKRVLRYRAKRNRVVQAVILQWHVNKNNVEFKWDVLHSV